MEEELTLKIATGWVSARPGCTAEQAHAVYGAARNAAKALMQAHKDWDAAELAEKLEPEGDASAPTHEGGGNLTEGEGVWQGDLPQA